MTLETRGNDFGTVLVGRIYKKKNMAAVYRMYNYRFSAVVENQHLLRKRQNNNMERVMKIRVCAIPRS
jgi:hypothetical protein